MKRMEDILWRNVSTRYKRQTVRGNRRTTFEHTKFEKIGERLAYSGQHPLESGGREDGDISRYRIVGCQRYGLVRIVVENDISVIEVIEVGFLDHFPKFI